MGKSTTKDARLPLWKHKGSGQWCRKVAGKFHYFGTDLEAALEEWRRTKDWILDGKEPPPHPDDDPASIAIICDAFMEFKEGLLNSGELSQRSFDGYHSTCKFLVEKLKGRTLATNLKPVDFQKLRQKMAKRWGPVKLGNEIQVIRSIFKYAYDSDLITAPVKFGPGFAKPSKLTLRKAKAEKGSRLFDPKEARAILKHSGPQMRAMVLLALNGGLGNTDVALLTLKHVQADDGWLVYPRTKTAIVRRIPLWEETSAAIKAAIKARTEPKNPDDKKLLFIGPRGLSYVGNNRGYRVHQEFQRAAIKAGSNRTFYDCRRTFQTIGEESGDIVAVGAVMGHAPRSDDMAAIYRQGVSDERLRSVVDRVHEWLYKGADDDDEQA